MQAACHFLIQIFAHFFRTSSPYLLAEKGNERHGTQKKSDIQSCECLLMFFHQMYVVRLLSPSIFHSTTTLHWKYLHDGSGYLPVVLTKRLLSESPPWGFCIVGGKDVPHFIPHADTRVACVFFPISLLNTIGVRSKKSRYSCQTS
jgi:hypothetical protein